MNVNEIGKNGIVGGVVAIIVEFIVGIIFHNSPGIVYDLSFIVMLLGGFVAGWMIKGKMEDGAGAGVVAGLAYVIFGLFIIYPLVSSYHSASPIGAIIVGIVLGAIGGFAGQYLAGSGKSSRKRR